MSDGSVGTVVLVHGGFVDGSGWEGVYKALKKDGYTCWVATGSIDSRVNEGR